MTNVGINVIETDGSAAPAIAGAPTSVAGVVLRSTRGPTDRAVRVSSFRGFSLRFGAHDSRFTGAYAMEGLFANGGTQAYVARVVGANAASARVTLLDRTGNPTVRVGAGYRGVEEVGTWGNDLYVDVRDNPEFSTPLAATRTGNQPARLQGNALAAQTVDLSVAAGNAPRRLRIVANGQNVDVTFDPASMPVLSASTPDDVAAAINAVGGARLVASASQGGVLIVSRVKGAASTIDAPTGFDDATRTLLGLNLAAVTGTAAPAGTYDEVQVTSYAGFVVGDVARLDDGITSDWITITSLEERQAAGGAVQFVVHFTAPGAPGQNEYRTADVATLSTTEFDLVVRRQSTGDPAPATVETWEKLSLKAAATRYAPTIVNDAFSGSGYVTLTDLNASTFTGRDVPALASGIRLGLPTPSTAVLARQAGDDGSDPTVAAISAAIAEFDTVAVQLLMVPEVVADAALPAVTRAALDWCAGRGDCMFIGHTPINRDVDGAKSFGQQFRSAKVYGALYWPWIDGHRPARRRRRADPHDPAVRPHRRRLCAHRPDPRGLEGACRRRRARARRARRWSARSPTRTTPTWSRTGRSTASGRSRASASSSTRRARCRPTRGGCTRTCACCSTTSRPRCATGCAGSSRSRTASRCGG